VHDLIAQVGVDVDGRRQRIVVGQTEGSAVGKDAGQPAHAELADTQQIALDLDVGKPPAVAREGAAPRLDVTLEVPVLLLEMLRLQKQPLRPDDFVMDRHSRTACRPAAVTGSPIVFSSRLMRLSIYNRSSTEAMKCGPGPDHDRESRGGDPVGCRAFPSALSRASCAS
jgi:hypothetical protein